MSTKRYQHIVFFAAILVAAMAVAVYAAGGNAPGEGGCGRGWHKGGGGAACLQNLSEEDRSKLESERQAFFTATDDLRRELYRKRLALKSEMAKKAPDAEAARALQKELSALHAQLEQQRIDHILKMKAINPNCGGWGGKPRRGHGGGCMGGGCMDGAY